MKKLRPTAIVILLSFILIGAANAEMPFGMDDEAPGYCRGMHQKGFGTQHSPGMIRGIGGITLKRLMHMDLSDAQKKEVANILAAFRGDSRALTDQLIEARKAFIDITHSKKSVDESAVRQSFKRMSDIMENLVVLRTKIMRELKQVLSRDQLKDLMDHPMRQSDWKDKRKEIKKRMNVHREMMDTWINTYADVTNPDN